LIVGFIYQYQSQLQQDLVNLSLPNAFSIAKFDSISIKAKSNSAMLIDTPMSQRKAMIHFYDDSFQFNVKYISLLGAEGARLVVDSNSEGAQFAPTITASVKAASTFFNVEFKLLSS
jgi:hypothetical protein